jgi:HSP20 family protein
MKSILRGVYLYKIETYNELLMDYYETDEHLVFEIDLPGIDPDNTSVGVYEDLLVIEGFRRNDLEGDDLKYICMERGKSNFKRIVKIPIHVDVTSGNATYKNGVVTIKFPKLKGKFLRIDLKRD